MNNLIHCDMCGYLMTKRWSETIDGKTYCRDCVPKKRLIDLGEPTEFDDKATEGADVEIERRCGMVTGASCGHVKRLCIEAKTGEHIDAMSCQLIDPQSGGVMR